MIGDNGNNGPGPVLTHIGATLPAPAIASTLRNPTAPMPSFEGLAQQSPQKFNEPGLLPVDAAVAASGDHGGQTSRPPAHARVSRSARHAGRDPGPGDVRPDRRPVRPDELGHDSRPAPPVAPPRRRPRRRSRRAAVRSTLRPAPATSRSSWPLAWRRAARSSASISRERMLELAPKASKAAGAARRALRVRQRARAALSRRRVRRRDGGLRRAQLRDLERGLCEMARVVSPGGRVVVLEITTPRRPPLSTFFELWFDRVDPRARAPRRRRAGVQLSAELGQAIPRTRGAGRGDVALRSAGDPLPADRRRDHRHSTWESRAMTATGAQAVVDAGGAELTAPLERVEQRMAQLAAGHGPRAGPPRRRHDRRRRQAAAAAARVPGGRRAPAGDRRAGRAPPSRSSSSTARRSCTTTSSTARPCAADARRSSPRRPRRRHRHRRSPVLACVRRARRRRLGRRGARAVHASRELALGELMQRADAWRVDVRSSATWSAAGSRPRCCSAPPASWARSRRRRRRVARRLRRADRACLPDPRRRARRHRTAGAHRQAAWRRPARRDGDAAADHRARARSVAGRRSTCADRTHGGRARSCASGSPRPARSRCRAPALEFVARPRRRAPGATGPLRQRAALELVADGVVERYA